MEIIGLMGHQGVGKNYIADLLLKNLPTKNTIIIAFADHFKVDCICKHNCDYNKVFGEKDYETRRLLQKVGTEEGRNKFGENIWINVVETWIKLLNERGINRFIISDVRFVNEAEWVKKMNGIIIKIDAPKRFRIRLEKETNNNEELINKIKNHKSEIIIDKYKKYDILIKNDLDDRLEIKKIVEKIDKILFKY